MALTLWFGGMAAYLLLFELGPALAEHREARGILGRRLEAHEKLETEVEALRRRWRGLEEDPQSFLLELDRRGLLEPIKDGRQDADRGEARPGGQPQSAGRALR